MFLTHSCPIRALLPLTRDSHLILHEDKKHLDISLFFLLFCWCCILSATLGSPAGLAIQYCLFPHLTFPESTETWGLPKLHIQAFGLALLITTAHYLPFVLFKKFSWTGYFFISLQSVTALCYLIMTWSLPITLVYKLINYPCSKNCRNLKGNHVFLVRLS